MKTQLAILCLYLLCHLTSAQEWYNDPQFYNGVVILNDRSTIRGDLSYNQSNELLHFKNGKVVKANEALYFQFYVPKEKFNRYFFSFVSSDRSYRFYEVLLNGKIPLYRKSIMVEKDLIESHRSMTNLMIAKNVIETQLFINHDDVMIALEDFKMQILPIMKDQIKSISKFIISEQLDLDQKSDQLIIIDYYNQLTKGN